MVVLGVIERGRVQDLGRDRAMPRGAERALVRVARRLRRVLLRGVVRVDSRAVLGADVVALPHSLGGIVVLPEHGEELFVARLRGVEHDEDDLVVAGHPGAHLAVRRVRRAPGGVSDRGRDDAFLLPEFLLHAPETTHPEHRAGEAGRERRDDPRAVHVVLLGDGHRIASTRERLRRGGDTRALREKTHGAPV